MGQFYASSSQEGRVSGLPRHLVNALVSYNLDAHWSMNANALLTTPILNNSAGTLVIPTQYQIDGGVAYNTKDWGVRVSVSNLTDEKNWSPPNAVYGNASIFALPGTQVQVNLKYRF